MKNIIRIAITTVALGLCTSAVHAGGSETSLVRDAHRLIDYSDDLKREVVRNFRHTREYGHLINDASKIRSEAKHLDARAHNVRSIRDVKCLKADVQDLDRLVCHVAEMLEDIDRGRSHRRYTCGSTRHAASLVAAMNRTLHSMERTVREMERRYSYSCEQDRGHGHSIYSRSRGSSRTHSRSSSSTGQRIAHSVLREVLRHR